MVIIMIHVVLKLNIHIYLYTVYKSNLMIDTWQYTKNGEVKMKTPFDQVEDCVCIK